MTAAATTGTGPELRASLGWAALRLQSDDRLAELVRDGHEQAFDAVVERYRDSLLRYAAVLVGTDRAQDIVQHTFEKALEHLRQDERPLQLRPWLYRVAHNGAVNELQRKGADYEQLDENYDGVPQPPDVVERGLRTRAAFRQINALPQRQRSALMLQAIGGLSYEQIADDMHVTPPVVRQLLYRARTSLRNALGAVVPVPVLHAWFESGGSDHSHIAELVTGAGAGGGVAKAGIALLATGVIATGTGVTVAQRQHHSTNTSSSVQAGPAQSSYRGSTTGSSSTNGTTSHRGDGGVGSNRGSGSGKHGSSSGPGSGGSGEGEGRSGSGRGGTDDQGSGKGGSAEPESHSGDGGRDRSGGGSGSGDSGSGEAAPGGSGPGSGDSRGDSGPPESPDGGSGSGHGPD